MPKIFHADGHSGAYLTVIKTMTAYDLLKYGLVWVISKGYQEKE